MTFKDLINQVLIRLREDAISVDWSGDINSSSEITEYQKLIAALVNDSKSFVESKHDWTALKKEWYLSWNTIKNTMELSGIGPEMRVLDFVNIEDGTVLEQISRKDLNKIRIPAAQGISSTGNLLSYFYDWDGPVGKPTHYYFEDINASDGDVRVTINPAPKTGYAANFVIDYISPQAELINSSDVVSVPHRAVMLGAWARAISERGEDGGTQNGVVAAEALDALNQAIILDQGHSEMEIDWYV